MATSRSVVGLAAIRAAVFALLITWACILPGTVGAAGAPFVLDGSTTTPHFAVRYESSDDFQARLLASIAEEELSRVAKDLNYTLEPGHPFPLRIYSSRNGFRANEGFKDSKWTVGATHSGDESIAIDASGLLVLPREVLSHEITHAIIFRKLGASISALPLWFNEGLAQYESRASQANNDALVADAAASASLLDLAALSTQFPPKQTDQAYAVSSSAIRYLIMKRGPASPTAVLQELARTGSFDKAMMKAAGMTGDTFADRWYAYTTSRLWIVRVARLVTGIVSAIMAMLVVAAFITRRRRMVQVAKQWEAEEFEEALRRQRGNDWSL